MIEFTERQKSIMQFIEQFRIENNREPVLMEIAQKFNIKTKMGVSNSLDLMRKKGFIYTRYKGKLKLIKA